MRKFSISTIALLCMGLMTATFATEAHAQRGKKSKKKGQTEAPKGRPDKDAIKSIDEVVKNCATLDGCSRCIPTRSKAAATSPFQTP